MLLIVHVDNYLSYGQIELNYIRGISNFFKLKGLKRNYLFKELKRNHLFKELK